MYECVCFKVGPLGGIEVECWWLTAGCGLQFLKGSFLRMSFSLKFFIPLPMTITHYIIQQNSSSLQNDHLKNCKQQSTVGVTWLPQRHLPGRFWNIHITHNSFQWHDGTDDKDDFSSSILHPRVRFLIQQRDKYFCAGLIHKVDSFLWIFTKFEAPKLGKTFQRRNSIPSW